MEGLMEFVNVSITMYYEIRIAICMEARVPPAIA